ncbi:MAG TPA: hypothetical protein DGX96_02165 [Lachnospiraceae bacterium]|jgi:electron transport complex protein RnfG|nr:hypothetical protein [Lachnospiraceae bacterium]
MSANEKTKEQTSTFHEYIYPVLILFIIVFVVTAALAVTNNVTAPIIEQKAEATANATRQELLPDADAFTQVTLDKTYTSDNGKASVTDYYTANNGSGAVVTVVTSSFGGDLTMMVGIDSTGAITGVEVTDSSDTPGVGSKDADPDYLAQYQGLTSLNSDDVKKDGQIDYISGASVSGTAIHSGVHVALTAYADLGVGGAN